MAMKQLTLPGEIVKKDNKLIRGKLNISNVIASRILASLVACVRADDQGFKGTYSLPVKNFLSASGGENYKEIKEVCRNLASATVEIEEPDPDCPFPDMNILHLYTLFSSIIYRNGIIKARFNWDMEAFLLNLQGYFTQYNLLEYLQLPSFYSQRIFEILKSWSGLPEVVLQLDELHHMLDTPPSFRANFAEFKRRVLEKAHKDINNKTELTFEWEAIKTGRAVTAIRFVFAKKKSLELQKKKGLEDRQRQLDKTNALVSKALACSKSINLCVPKQNDVCGVCQRMGFTK